MDLRKSIQQKKMRRESFILGLGFDAEDGHKRITQGENFYIVGGSKQTHGFMQQGCIKFNEELKKKHKSLNSLSHKEFYDLAHKSGFRIPQQKKKDT